MLDLIARLERICRTRDDAIIRRKAARDRDLGAEVAADLNLFHHDAIAGPDGCHFDRLVAKDYRAGG